MPDPDKNTPPDSTKNPDPDSPANGYFIEKRKALIAEIQSIMERTTAQGVRIFTDEECAKAKEGIDSIGPYAQGIKLLEEKKSVLVQIAIKRVESSTVA